jgi:hypothetical protein
LTAGEEHVHSAGQALADTNALMKVVHNSIEWATGHHACLLCTRGFSQQEEDKFLQTQRQKEATVLPNMKAQNEARLNEANAAVATLQRARPHWEECRRLKENDLPKAEGVLQTCARAPGGVLVWESWC